MNCRAYHPRHLDLRRSSSMGFMTFLMALIFSGIAAIYYTNQQQTVVQNMTNNYRASTISAGVVANKTAAELANVLIASGKIVLPTTTNAGIPEEYTGTQNWQYYVPDAATPPYDSNRSQTDGPSDSNPKTPTLTVFQCNPLRPKVRMLLEANPLLGPPTLNEISAGGNDNNCAKPGMYITTKVRFLELSSASIVNATIISSFTSGTTLLANNPTVNRQNDFRISRNFSAIPAGTPIPDAASGTCATPPVPSRECCRSKGTDNNMCGSVLGCVQIDGNCE